jgi:hypothetical protein
MKRREDEFPTKEGGSLGGDTYKHDAYATIVMTVVSGGDVSMFGSDLKHSQRIRISVQRATLDRKHSNDWIHGGISDRSHLLTFEMSHSQFAQFITSNGNGNGTPVTLRYAPPPGTPAMEMPGIKNIETKAEIQRREIRDCAAKQLGELRAEVARLGAMLETGKIGLKEAREIHRSMSIQIGNLPANMEFVVEQGEEALEKAQMAAKIEIEAYIDHAARRMGLDNLAQLGKAVDRQLESGSDA